VVQGHGWHAEVAFSRESLALFARMPEARADSRRLKDDASAATQQWWHHQRKGNG